MSGRMVLAIEDSEADIFALRRTMQQVAPEVGLTHAADAETGLRHLRAGHVDLVLLDLNLPGISGRELLRRITADGGVSTPIVVLSTSAHPGDVSACYELGAKGYVRKPVDLERFRTIVSTVLAYWLDIVEPPPLEVPDP